MKVVYSAVFHEEGKGYSVEFPDLPGCITQGDTLEQAIEMAEDAALGWLLISVEDGEELPKPTDIEKIKVTGKDFKTPLLLDLGAYTEKYGKKTSVKKTLTIPAWLNALAEKKKINFSQTLQEALIEKTYKVR